MKEIKVNSIDIGQRIDKFLKKEYKNIPNSFLYKTFRKKDIKVNGKHVKESYILKENDVITLYIDDSKLEDFKYIKNKKIDDKFNLDIVYEDKNILIVNKERGILVHGDKKEKRYTLSNYVLNYLANKNEFDFNSSNYIPSPTHRIDRNTSGLVCFAKNYISSKILCEAFLDKNKISKNYIALIKGKCEKEITIDKPLYKVSKDNRVYLNYEKGLKSITLVKNIETINDFSIVKATLLTGRTHQIRVHLASNNLPIIGDNKYGDFTLNKLIEDKYKFYKQFLHAYSLSFINIDNELSYLNNKIFYAKLKKDELELLNELGFNIEYIYEELI